MNRLPSIAGSAVLLLTLLVPGRANAQVVTTYSTGLTEVFGIAFDAAGNLYASGFVSTSGVVRRIPVGGGPATTFAGGFQNPKGLAFSPTGDLYVADLTLGGGPGRVFKVTPAGARSIFADGFAMPYFLGFDGVGNLLVGEWTGRRLKRVTPAGLITDYGPPLGGPGEWVGQFVIDPSGEIHIAVGPYIKRIGPGGTPVTNFASGLGAGIGLARGSGGEFYLSRYNLGDLWTVSAGGTGRPWSSGLAGCVDGPLEKAKFTEPIALAVHDTRLFIVDRDCGAVRVIDTPTPALASSWGRVKATYR